MNVAMNGTEMLDTSSWYPSHNVLDTYRNKNWATGPPDPSRLREISCESELTSASSFVSRESSILPHSLSSFSRDGSAIYGNDTPFSVQNFSSSAAANVARSDNIKVFNEGKNSRVNYDLPIMHNHGS